MKYEDVEQANHIKEVIDKTNYLIDYFTDMRDGKDELLQVKGTREIKRPLGCHIIRNLNTKRVICDAIICDLKKELEEFEELLEQL